MTKRIAMGMSHPAGRSRTFSENGRNFCERSVSACVGLSDQILTYCDDFIVFYCYHDCCDQNENAKNVPCCSADQYEEAKESRRATYVYISVIERFSSNLSVGTPCPLVLCSSSGLSPAPFRCHLPVS